MSEPLPILRYSTEAFPPEERYARWYLRDWPRQRPIYRTQPTEPFDTSWETTQLGSIIFAVATITAMRWERHIQDIRESDFDPIILNLMVRGEAQGQIDGLPFHETSGMGHFHDLSLPSLHMSTGSFMAPLFSTARATASQRKRALSIVARTDTRHGDRRGFLH